MPDPIVASVVEPPRTPRPTIQMVVKINGSDSEVVSAMWDIHKHGPLSSEHSRLEITIPGSIEAERAARIEKARQEVIDAAKIVAAIPRPSTQLADALADLRDALTVLAESEGSSNG